MHRLFTWFLPRFVPTLEKRLEAPVTRLDLKEAQDHASRLKGAKYASQRQPGLFTE